VNRRKARFFDNQADQPWACEEYSQEERLKIQSLFREGDISRGMNVLEPGCGTGRLTRLLSERVGPEGSVVAFEISTQMLDVCRNRVSSMTNVTTRMAAAETFSWQPEVFDRVVCHNVFPHFDDKSAAVRCLAGALKSSGRFIVFHFMPSWWINDLHRKACTAVQDDMIPEEPEMRRLFTDAGLTVESFRDDEQGYFLSARFIGA